MENEMDRFLEIYKVLQHGGLRVLMLYGNGEVVYCIGDKDWSRCVRIRTFAKNSLNPYVEILKDDGGELGKFCSPSAKERIGYSNDVEFSQFVSRDKVSMMEYLEPEKHQNERLRSVWDKEE